MSGLRMSSVRNRKQRFPRQERRRTPVGEILRDDDFSMDEESYQQPIKRFREMHPVQPARTAQHRLYKKEIEDKHSNISRVDKRARDEHNEQERSRRRELAVIYELIRASFTADDLRHLDQSSAPKSIEKLSYPQVLQIAYNILLEEHHNICLFEKTLSDVRLLEKELSKQGLPVPPRPPVPSLTENYRKVVHVVEGILKSDKAARTSMGHYDLTPADRAAMGDQQLSFLRNRSQHLLSDTMELIPPERRSHAPPQRRHSYQVSSRSSSSVNQSHYVSSAFSSRLSPNEGESSPHHAPARSSSIASLDDADDFDLPLLPPNLSLFRDPLPELQLDEMDLISGL